jgi:tRNA(Ile2) C34 agmatinyltransferase TiaS
MFDFLKPKCPECGNTCQPTGYSFPYAQWRCYACLSLNRRIEKMLKEKLSDTPKEATHD